GARHGKSRLVQPPQVVVLARDPDGLLSSLAGAGALPHGLARSLVADVEAAPVDGVVAEGPRLDIAVDLGGQSLLALGDEEHRRLLAALQLAYEAVEVAAVEEELHVVIGELSRARRSRLLLVPQQVVASTLEPGGAADRKSVV